MAPEGRQRIDKWLFFARVVKSRSLAQKLVAAGRVRINRDKAAQSSDLVGVDDVLTITLDSRIFVYRVQHAGVRRGPAEEARTLYEDMSPPATTADALPDALAPLRDAGAGRPTKRERRAIDRLMEPE
jgi:ribosome-associated heat shock protein Hsp15